MAMSNADRARMTTDESGRTMSNEDRARARRIKMMLLRAGLGDESGRTMSDQDRMRAEDAYLKRNDGGMAMSGRGKPVRTF